MRILIAPDSFKGTLTAGEAARCIEQGLCRGWPGVSTTRLPVGDGGEGTVDAVLKAVRGYRRISCRARDPLGRPIRAAYGLSGDGRTAVIEMAAASGLTLLSARERNPLKTGTAGTGDLIRHALDRGALRLLLGIGGSATNDGGMGMARALGARFLDAGGREIPEGGGSLRRLARVDLRRFDPRVRGAALDVACDVRNPLYGPRGAAVVFGPQKGATSRQVLLLDEGLRRYARVLRRDLGVDVSRLPGGGAAGGLGAGLVAFCGGRLQSGIDLVLDLVGFDGHMAEHDLVITGEGRLDGQTLFGKVVSGVAGRARRFRRPVLVLCGSAGPGASRILEAGVTAYFAALSEPVPDAELPGRAPGLLRQCARQVGRLLALTGGGRPGRPPVARTVTRSSARGCRRRTVPA